MDKFTYRPLSTSGCDIRMDGAVYISDGEKRDGLVESVLRSSRFKKHWFILMRRLT